MNDLFASLAPASNNGPPLDEHEGWISLAEAQADPSVHNRPSYLQRYCGPGAPKHEIVGIGRCDSFGRWVLLTCGHWRAIRDWDVMPILGRERPKSARCGCCRMKIRPAAADVISADELRDAGRAP